MTDKNKKNNTWQYSFEFTQPYNSHLPNGGFTDDAVDKLLEICDGDFEKLDQWIVEQLEQIAEEIKEDQKQLEFNFEETTTLEEQREMFDRLFK